MSQGWYRGKSNNPQSNRAIDPIFFISYAPNSTPTVGVKGQFAIEISTGNLWQKQDDGKTTNWVLFTGSGTVTSENVIIKNLICDSGVSILDLCYFSGGTLLKVTNSNQINLGVAGICVAKPSPTLCDLLLIGKVSGFVGLTPGQSLYVGSGGGLVSTPPMSGYVQFLGQAIDTTTISFNPKIPIGLS